MEIERVRKLSKIQVIIRKRPLNQKETKGGQSDIVEVIDQDTLVIREQKVKVDMTKYIEENYFTFDKVFDELSTNQQVFLGSIQENIEFVFQGGKVSCFAYGQTGSGKTHTMIGNSKEPGVYLLAAEQLFNIRDFFYKGFVVKVSYFEIYCGKLFDLLNGREQIIAREDNKQNIQIIGLSKVVVRGAAEIAEMISKGNQLRITSTTGKNNESSRSHAILQFEIFNQQNSVGLFSFIDLAGNERGADTAEHNQQTRIDGAEISKSLLALKECIRCLDQDKKHIPFRGSKLTMVLRDSFIGECRTVMIGNISPGSLNSEYTLNTLRYADRVKELKNDKFKKKSDLMLPRQKSNQQKKIVPNVCSSQNLPEEGYQSDKQFSSVTEFTDYQQTQIGVLNPHFKLEPKARVFAPQVPFEMAKEIRIEKNVVPLGKQFLYDNEDRLRGLENDHSVVINQIIEGEELVKNIQLTMVESNRALDDKSLQI